MYVNQNKCIYIIRNNYAQVDGLQKGPRRLLLPGGTVHAMIERSSGEEWNCYVGDERRMTVVRRVVANNTGAWIRLWLWSYVFVYVYSQVCTCELFFFAIFFYKVLFGLMRSGIVTWVASDV